jgi:hypothetical protein
MKGANSGLFAFHYHIDGFLGARGSRIFRPAGKPNGQVQFIAWRRKSPEKTVVADVTVPRPLEHNVAGFPISRGPNR